MDESNIVIKAEIVDTDDTSDEDAKSNVEPDGAITQSGVIIKTEPIESEVETNGENSSIPTELNSDLVLMIINVTIANSCYKDLHTKLLSHKKLPGSYSVVITRANFNYFPKIPTLNPTNKTVHEIDNADNISLIDLEKNELERSELNVVENPFRIVISGTTLKASFQAFGKEKFSVPNVIEWNVTAWKVSEEFLPLLGYLSRQGDSGVFRVCEGIQDEDIRSNDDVSVTSLSLVTIATPFPRYESANCSIVQPAQYKNKCPSCLKWYANLRGYRKRKSQNVKDREFSDTDVSSTTRIGILSPERLRERLSNIQSERKCLHRRVKSLEDQLKKLENKLEKKADNKKAKKK